MLNISLRILQKWSLMHVLNSHLFLPTFFAIALDGIYNNVGATCNKALNWVFGYLWCVWWHMNSFIFFTFFTLNVFLHAIHMLHLTKSFRCSIVTVIRPLMFLPFWTVRALTISRFLAFVKINLGVLLENLIQRFYLTLVSSIA